MKTFTPVEKTQFANPGWSYAFTLGFVQGKAEALASYPPTADVWNARDEYAYGYRSAYNSYWQGTTAEHRMFLYRMSCTN